MASDMACSLGSPLSPFSAANILSSNSANFLFLFCSVSSMAKAPKAKRLLYWGPSFFHLWVSPVMNRTLKGRFSFFSSLFWIFPPKTSLKDQIFSPPMWVSEWPREREKKVSALNTIIFCLFMLARPRHHCSYSLLLITLSLKHVCHALHALLMLPLNCF